MLIWSQLSQRFWGEATSTANYLQNFLPCGQDSSSPNELWNRNKPFVGHFQTFGYVAHVHIPGENQAKLDRVFFQGIFVRYHSNQQVQIYNPSTWKVQ